MLRTRASSCTSPKAPRERLSVSTSCRLTTLPDSSVIFFCASSMRLRCSSTRVKVSVVFSKPSARRFSTWPLISLRRSSVVRVSPSTRLPTASETVRKLSWIWRFIACRVVARVSCWRAIASRCSFSIPSR